MVVIPCMYVYVLPLPWLSRFEEPLPWYLGPVQSSRPRSRWILGTLVAEIWALSVHMHHYYRNSEATFDAYRHSAAYAGKGHGRIWVHRSRWVHRRSEQTLLRELSTFWLRIHLILLAQLVIPSSLVKRSINEGGGGATEGKTICSYR